MLAWSSPHRDHVGSTCPEDGLELKYIEMWGFKAGVSIASDLTFALGKGTEWRMVLLSGLVETVCAILPTHTHQSALLPHMRLLLQTLLSSFLREAALTLGRLEGLPHLCTFSPHFQSRCFSDLWVWPLLCKAHSRFPC